MPQGQTPWALKESGPIMLAVAQNKKYVNIDILILFGYVLKTTYPSSTRGDIQTPGVGRISRPSAGFFTSTAL
jgi:hypothetical protein